MKILHLTDLHFTNEIGNRTKQQKLIDNLIKDFEENISEIDYIIFSGDIVKKGSSKKDFELVQEIFLERILKCLKVSRTNFFICPGNHDVDRSAVSNAVIKYLDESIKTNEGLDDFFYDNNPDLLTSHKPLKNYTAFLKKFFIYCFLLCDINYKQHKDIIKDVIPLIKIPIIKYSFILKMNYYLGFKSNLKSNDKQYLKNNIQSQYLKFNSTLDVGTVQKSLSKK